MHDFQWVVSDFLLLHLRGRLIAALVLLLAVIAITSVLVRIELRRNREDEHADQ